MQQRMALNGFAASLLLAGLVASCNKNETPNPAPVSTPPATVAPKPTLTTPAVTTPTAQAPFEGEIQVQVVAPAEKAPKSLVFEVKSDNVRYEEGTPTAPTYTIANLGQKKVYAVADAQKDYVELTADNTAPKAGDTAQVKKTGKMEKIAGYDCEDWQLTTNKEQLDVCAAKEIAYFDLVSSTPATAAEPAWASELTKAKAFPLRLIAHDKAGKEEFRVEATKISRKPLEMARFNVPTGYHKVALSKDITPVGIPMKSP